MSTNLGLTSLIIAHLRRLKSGVFFLKINADKLLFMNNTQLQFCSRTHKGKIRSSNQDRLGVDHDMAYAVIADGVGGKSFGEVASQLCIDSCFQYLSTLGGKELSEKASKELANAIKVANEEIITIQRNEPKYQNMSSTMTCFYINENHLHYAWVGDSRLYLLRPASQTITMLTADHTLDRSKIDPELAPSLYKKAPSILTRVVGSILLLKPDVGSMKVNAGDIILACTDGLSSLVPDDLMLDYTLKTDLTQREGLEQLADRLIDRALDCGGHDNVSLILSKVI